jgi:hypothetical protein
MQIAAKELDDGSIFVLEPKRLQTFALRFHLFTSSAEPSDTDDQRVLFSGADGIVLVLSAREDERPHQVELVASMRNALAHGTTPPDQIPTVLQLMGPWSADAVGSLQSALGLAAHPKCMLAHGADALGDAFVAISNAIAGEIARSAPDPRAAAELATYATLPFASS